MNDYVKPLVEKRMEYLEKEIEHHKNYQEDLIERLEKSRKYVDDLETESSELGKLQSTPRSKVLQK